MNDIKPFFFKENNITAFRAVHTKHYSILITHS